MSGGYATIPSSDANKTVEMTISSDRIIQQKVGRPSHKMVVLLHSVFKLSALTIYIGASFISNSFIGCFIMVMILLSADFWVVKNVSGRLLAGLRWWSVLNDEGNVVWRYESWTAEERSLAQQGESTFFWMVIISQQVIWSILAFVALFR